MTNPVSYIKNTRKTYRKDLQEVITEVQVQFSNEEPAWIPFATLLSMMEKFDANLV